MKRNIDNTYYVYSELGDTDDITDIINNNDITNKRNICNDEFIKMLSSGNIYEHTKEPYDDKYDTEVITEEQDIDDNGRSFIPVTIKVYKKGDKIAYTRKENVYPVTIFDNDEKVGIILKNDKYKMMDIYPTSGPQTTKYNTMLEPPDKFNTKKLTTMYQMFTGCKKMTKTDVSNFNTSNVTNMSWMFNSCNSLTTLDVSKWDTSKVTDMNFMFNNCQLLTTLDVSKWNTSKVTDMSYMFSYCNKLTTLNVSNFNTSNVTNMYCMFDNCQSLTSLDVSNFNTSKVTDMHCMFDNCQSLTTLDVSNFNISNVTNMSYMFEGCKSLTTLDVSKWDTSNVTSMSWMFCSCINLTTITGVIDMKSCTNYNNMFSECAKLTGVKLKNVPSGFNASNAGLKAGQYTIVS